jgi:hypothetical protein
MFILVNQVIIGSTVAFLRIGSHAISFGDRELASLIVGLVAGQLTTAGAYPPEGEFGNARLMPDNGTASASAARISGEASRGTTIAFAITLLACCGTIKFPKITVT